MPAGTVWKGPMKTVWPMELGIQALASAGAGTTTPDVSLGGYITQTFTAATRTIGVPLNARVGQRIFFDITNTSGGAITITWNAVFKQAATAPASTKRRVLSFVYDGTNWVQDGVGVDL